MKLFASGQVLVATLLTVSFSSLASSVLAAPTTPSAAPGFLGSNGLPRVGMRIVFDAGGQTIRGTDAVRRDASGRLLDQYGNPVPDNQIDNHAGVGYTTIDIVQSSPSLVAADESQFLRIGPNLTQAMRTGAVALQGDGSRLADFWVSPAALAKMAVGTHGGVTVSRGRLTVAGHEINTLSVNTTNADGHIYTTYDLGSGLLLNTSSDQRANPSQRNLAPEQDARITTYCKLMGVRQLGFSWVSDAPPASLTTGHKLSYRGGIQMSTPNVPTMPPMPLSSEITVTKREGLCVFAQATSSLASVTGQPQQSTSSHVYGSASADALWVPVAALAALHAGQVVDKDPITGFQVTFEGVQNDVATFLEQDTVQRNLRLYSTKSGLEVGSRSDTQMGMGVQSIFLQLAGEG